MVLILFQTGLIYYTILLLSSFALSYMLIPKISAIMYSKKILDKPNIRSSHVKSIPNLGGISFYIVLMLGFFFIKENDNHDLISHLTPGLTILFILGLKDDLLCLSAKVKLLGQIVAVGFILTNPYFVITNFHGFMGIHEIHYIVGVIITAFILIGVINAFNLIDGIDGLASVIATVVLVTFAVIFALSDQVVLSGVCIILIGSILAFLRYNLSVEKKIFMGDTGSMCLGLIIAVLSIALIQLMGAETNIFGKQKTNIPYILLAILIVPLFDTLRVFLIRILNKKGPFSPDRNHTHHILIDYKKFSHLKASLVIASFNILAISIFTFIASVFNQWIMLTASILLFLILTFYFFIINNNFSARKLKYKISKIKKG